jgi:hypothetical protein
LKKKLPLAFWLKVFFYIRFDTILLKDFPEMDTLLEIVKIIVSAILGAFAGRYLKLLDRQKERDKETYEQLLKALPTSGGMAYIRDRDMAGAIKEEYIDDLREFVEVISKHPDFIFVDRSLEKKKKELALALKNLLHQLDEVTESIRYDPVIIKLPQPHTFPDSQQWTNIKNELNQKANNADKIYSDLISEARRKL